MDTPVFEGLRFSEEFRALDGSTLLLHVQVKSSSGNWSEGTVLGGELRVVGQPSYVLLPARFAAFRDVGTARVFEYTIAFGSRSLILRKTLPYAMPFYGRLFKFWQLTTQAFLSDPTSRSEAKIGNPALGPVASPILDPLIACREYRVSASGFVRIQLMSLVGGSLLRRPVQLIQFLSWFTARSVSFIFLGR